MVAASFSESNSLLDPDGLVLLWDLHSPLKSPEFVFNCQVRCFFLYTFSFTFSLSSCLNKEKAM